MTKMDFENGHFWAPAAPLNTEFTLKNDLKFMIMLRKNIKIFVPLFGRIFVSTNLFFIIHIWEGPPPQPQNSQMYPSKWSIFQIMFSNNQSDVMQPQMPTPATFFFIILIHTWKALFLLLNTNPVENEPLGVSNTSTRPYPSVGLSLCLCSVCYWSHSF